MKRTSILTSIFLLLFVFTSFCQGDHNAWCPPVDAVTITSTINICKGETITGTTNFSLFNVTYNRFRNICYQTCSSNDVKASDLSVSGPNILNIPDYLYYGASPSFTAKPSESATYTMVMKRRCSTLAGDFSVQGVTERTWTEVINVIVTDPGKPTTPTYTIREDANNLDTYSIQTSGCTEPSLTKWTTLVHNGLGWFTGSLLEFATQIPVTVWAGCVKHKPVNGVSVADYCYSDLSSPLCIIPRPTISSNPDTIRCGKGIATLSASSCNGTVTWSNGMTGQSIITDPLTQSTDFTAKCTGFCPLNRTETIEGTSLASEKLTVIVKPKPPKPTINISNVDASSIKLTAEGCENGSSYIWEKQIIATGLWKSLGENGKDVIVPAVSDECRQYRSACLKDGCQTDFGLKKIEAPNKLTVSKDNNLIKSKCPVKVNWEQTKGCTAITDSATITVSKNGNLLYSKKVKSTDRSYEINVSDFMDKRDFYGLKGGDNLKVRVEAQLENGGSTSSEIDVPVEAEPTRKAGVTVLTQGFQALGSLPDAWQEIARTVRKTASSEDSKDINGNLIDGKGATIYINKGNVWEKLPGNNGSGDNNEEIIFLYDWASTSNKFAPVGEKNGYLELAADNLYAMLRNAKGAIQGDIIESNKNLLLMGHSRGCVMLNQFNHRIYNYHPNKVVDMNMWDCHPATTYGDTKLNDNSIGNLPTVLGRASDCESIGVGCRNEGTLRMGRPCNVRNYYNTYRKDGTYENVIGSNGSSLTLGSFDALKVNGACNLELDDNLMAQKGFAPLIGGTHSGLLLAEMVASNLYSNEFDSKTYNIEGLYPSRKCNSGLNKTRLNGEDKVTCPLPADETCLNISDLNNQLAERRGSKLEVLNGNFNIGNEAGYVEDIQPVNLKIDPFDSNNNYLLLGDYSLSARKDANISANVLTKVTHELIYFHSDKGFLNVDLKKNNSNYMKVICSFKDLDKNEWIYKTEINGALNQFTKFSIPVPTQLLGSSGNFSFSIEDDTKLLLVDNIDLSNQSSNLTFDFVKQLTYIESVIDMPTEVTLLQNAPNPFEQSTQIKFGLPKPQTVSLKLFDVVGKQVSVITEGNYLAGWHTVLFDAKQLSAGTYLYRLETEKGIKTEKMLLLR